MSKGILQSKVFYCEHISASDRDILDFTVRHPEVAKGLEYYIKELALPDEMRNTMRTYLVRDLVTDGLVGYFSLKAGMVSLNEREVMDEQGRKKKEFDTVPGIEIANFAVNESYCKMNPEISGLGVLIFREFIQKLAYQAAEVIGAMVLYIFALPYDSLLERYSKSYCFLRLLPEDEVALHKRLKPAYDETCIFMYQIL